MPRVLTCETFEGTSSQNEYYSVTDWLHYSHTQNVQIKILLASKFESSNYVSNSVRKQITKATAKSLHSCKSADFLARRLQLDVTLVHWVMSVDSFIAILGFIYVLPTCSFKQLEFQIWAEFLAQLMLASRDLLVLSRKLESNA